MELFLDQGARRLYVVDAGARALRWVDLTTGAVPSDGAFGGAARPVRPTAVNRCPNGDVFLADTGGHRVLRHAVGKGPVRVVLGNGSPASSGTGTPARVFPVDSPAGLACDARGNLYVSSRTSLRLLPADELGRVDGSGPVLTVYGAQPRDSFPASATACLTGVAVLDDTRVQVADACAGMVVELARVAE